MRSAQSWFVDELDRLAQDLKPYARTLEQRARLFLSIFLPAFVTALVTASPAHWTLALVLSIALPLAVSALNEIDPMIPWSVFLRRIRAAKITAPLAPPRSALLPQPPITARQESAPGAPGQEPT